MENLLSSVKKKKAQYKGILIWSSSALFFSSHESFITLYAYSFTGKMYGKNLRKDKLARF